MRMAAMVIRAGAVPRTAARRMAPLRCPLAPVPGMVKLIICAAKVKAPSTAMNGSFSRVSSGELFGMVNQMMVALATNMAPPTPGDISASDMCMGKLRDVSLSKERGMEHFRDAAWSMVQKARRCSPNGRYLRFGRRMRT